MIPSWEENSLRAVARDAQARLAAIVEGSDDAIIGKDLAGVITTWNRGAGRLFGYEESEVVGQHCTLLVPPERHQEEADILDQLRRGLRVDHFETIGKRKDGTTFHISLTASPIVDAEGRVVGASKIARDITARKQGELLRAAQKEALEKAARGASLLEVLEFLTRTAESQSPANARMAIHLLDETGRSFTQTAAATLPAHYAKCVDGVEVSSAVGTCCASVTRRERVVLSDIAASQDFPQFAAFALPLGLRAAWSTPIFSSIGKVLGTFVCYYGEVREPGPQDDLLGSMVAQTAALVIERSQTVAAMRLSEQRFRTAVSIVSSLIWTNSAEGKMEGEQPGWASFTGQTQAEYQGYGWAKAVHLEDAGPTVEAWKQAVAQKKMFAFEHRLRRADGEWRLCSVRAVPVLSDAGTILEWVGVHTDVTEQRRAEEALRARDEFMRSIIESSPDCIKVLDLEGRLLSLEAGQQLLGIPDITPYLNTSWIDFWSRDEDRAVAFETVSAAAAGKEGKFIGFFRTLHGEDKWWEVAITPILSAEGHPARLLAVSRDVTQRRELEDVLIARAEELARADRSKDEFLAMLAHELRNPLGPLSNASELLNLESATADERAQARRIISRQIENMSRMIDDLLDVSRITAGKIELRKTPVSLETILTAASSLARSGFSAHRQELTVSLPGEPIFLEADATRLEQVFGNLLSNACKYAGDGCHIALSAKREDQGVAISVRDDGAGIAPDLLPRIFDLFVQASRTLDRSHGGLGIGLTLVQRLVRLHGGSIEARSEGLGKGAEFIVHLPVLAKAPRRAPLPPVSITGSIPRRILIVDDNTDSAGSMATLQSRRGHTTRTAFTGPQALLIAAEFEPEVVLLDIGLPGMDGFEVAKRIRSMPALAEILLIAMTGYASLEDRSQARAAGFDEHLVKPVDLRVLSGWLEDHPRLASSATR